METRTTTRFGGDSKKAVYSPEKRITTEAARLVGDIWATVPKDIILLVVSVTLAYWAVSNG